jgi:hypothetical protein
VGGGDEDMVSMVDQIIAGKGIFAGLYDMKDQTIMSPQMQEGAGAFNYNGNAHQCGFPCSRLKGLNWRL